MTWGLRLRRILPQGSSLPAPVWENRHRAILVLLWLHAVGIPVFALLRGYTLAHTLVESAIVPMAAILAGPAHVPRRIRTAATSLGLLTSSAILVHLSGGLIEMHFHFFVMVAVVALYQDWLPFLAAIGYVLVHHGLMGTVAPESVFNHPEAWSRPWTWAGIHALFIAGISAACLVTWRLNELLLDQRRRAEDRLRVEQGVIATLNDVGKILASELDHDKVVQTIADAATGLTEAEFGAFFYNVADDTGLSTLYALSGVPRSAFEDFGIPRNTELFGSTFAGEGPIRIDDVTQDPRYGPNSPQGHLPIRSYLAVPVKSRAGVIGGLFFGHSLPGRFTDVHEKLAAGIAAHAAVALDNARLYESERGARAGAEAAEARMRIMAEASRVLSSTLDIEEVLHRLATLVASSVADSCVVDVLNDDGTIRRVAAVADPFLQDVSAQLEAHPPDLRDGTHPVARAIASSKTQVIERTLEAILETDDPTAARRIASSAIVVPLIHRGDVLGAVTLGIRGENASAEDIHLAEELAFRAAIAVENARLYSKERGVAEMLQRSLLPESLPELPGIEFAARYEPGGSDAEIGGDWYDILELPRGALGLAMGDVVGRGVPAASLMGQLRNALRAYALEGYGPAQVLTRLNTMLSQLGNNNMATLFYGVLDTETCTLRYANAGHVPALVATPDGNVTLLDETLAVPLGALRHAEYVEAMTALSPDSTLVLYTDGLIEERGISLDDGIDRLRRTISSGGHDIEKLCDHVMTTMLGDRDTMDDVALLAIRPMQLGRVLKLKFLALPRVLRPLRATLRRWLREAGASEQETHEILVACVEACANAIQHASGPTPTTFEFEGVAGENMEMWIRDGGKWRAPKPDADGRGLQIMEAFMDEVEIVRRSNGTEVHMRRRLAHGHAHDRHR